MAGGKDTKAALLLALAPKEGKSPVESGERESEGDDESTGRDILDAISEDDPKALYGALRRLVMSCMSEEDSEGEG